MSIKKIQPLTFLFMAVLLMSAGCDKDNNPAPDRLRTSAKLASFSTCGDLEETLKANLKEEMRIQLLTTRNIPIYYGPEDGTTTDNSAPKGGSGREEGVDYSGTNNQETGVDEADFVKTDGYYIYVLNGNQLVTSGVPEFGLLEKGSTFELEGYPSQMLLSKNASDGSAAKAVVFSTVYTWDLPEGHPLHDLLLDNGTIYNSVYSPYYRCSDLTKLTVIDLSDPANPKAVRELYIEGYYQTARRIESAVHMVSYSWMEVQGLKYWPDLPEDYYALDNETKQKRIWDEAVQITIAYNNETIDSLSLADLVPRIYELSSDDTVTVHDFAQKGCTNFTIARDGVSRGFTSIISLSLLAEEFSFDADHIVSNWSTVYASADTMLIAEPAQNWWWYWGNEEYKEATNIHRFSLSPDGTALYAGSGRIEGTVENQFSLSEYKGSLRIASTTGQWNQWWLENPAAPENHVYVLQQGDNNTLNTVGHIGGIAKGEKIWSARFTETKGYLVTFRNMDPLWTVDLSDPANPAIIGKLDVPGVSTYIHPLSESRLLTIGYGGDETGLNWSIEVSLFNVADFANPKLIDNLSLSANTSDNTTSSGGWSEAVYEHKAFQYWGPKKMLAVPLSTYRYTYKNEYDYFYEYMSTLTLLDVDNETGFSLHGSVDHSAFYNSDTSMYWCYQDIRRSIFMGDYIYAISDRGITANALDNMTSTASIELPGSNCGGYGY